MSTLKLLQQQSYDYLKQQILSNKLNLNEIYSETKLANDIGISRTPMRNALQRLSQEGLIDIIPSKGFRLHKVSTCEIIETFEVRSAIEGYCAFLLAKHHETLKAKNTINLLESFLSKQEEILQNDQNISDFVKYDNIFHTTIVEYAENKEFNNMFSRYMYRIKTLATESLSQPGRMEATLKEHISILNCIKKGDISNIYNVTSIHMETPKSIHLKSISDENYFI